MSCSTHLTIKHKQNLFHIEMFTFYYFFNLVIETRTEMFNFLNQTNDNYI